MNCLTSLRGAQLGLTKPDGQTDRQLGLTKPDEQTDRQTDRQADRQTERQNTMHKSPLHKRTCAQKYHTCSHVVMEVFAT